MQISQWFYLLLTGLTSFHKTRATAAAQITKHTAKMDMYTFWRWPNTDRSAFDLSTCCSGNASMVAADQNVGWQPTGSSTAWRTLFSDLQDENKGKKIGKVVRPKQGSPLSQGRKKWNRLWFTQRRALSISLDTSFTLKFFIPICFYKSLVLS